MPFIEQGEIRGMRGAIRNALEAAAVGRTLRGPEVKALSHHKAAEFRVNGEIYGISLIGFDGPEEQGVWSRHKNAKVFLPIGLDAGGEGISVWFEITPYCPGEYQQELSIALEDGRRCDFWFGPR